MPRYFAASQRLDVPAKTTTILRNRLTWSLMCWVKAPSGTIGRNVYTEDGASFNDQVSLGFNNSHQMEGFFRTPTNFADINSVASFDDNVWHRVLWTRIGVASFQLWVDDVSVGTSAVSCSTSAVTTNGNAIGNFTAAAITAGDAIDAALLGSMFRLVALTEAITAREARRILYTGRTNRNRIFHYELLGQYPEPSLAGLPGGVGLAQAITAASDPGVTTSLPPGVSFP